MPVTNNDLLKCDLRYTVAGIGVNANVFQARVYQASPHDVPDADVIASLSAWMYRVFDPMLPHIVLSFTNPVGTVYKKIGTQWNLLGSFTAVDMDGESIGDPLPSGVAMMALVATDTSRVVGKKYIGGLSENAITAGLWLAPVLAAMATSAVQWIAQFQDESDETTWYVPGVYSTKALAFKAFTSTYTVGNIPAYQRRRKALVGA